MAGDKITELQTFMNRLSGGTDAKFETLTSAQRMKALAWAKKNGIDISELIESNGPRTDILEIQHFGSAQKLYAEDVSGTSSASIGCDIQSIVELLQEADAIAPKESFGDFFSDLEYELIRSASNPAQRLSGFFAAKEAIFKSYQAIGVNRPIETIQIWVDEKGVPRSDDAAISISHSVDYVMAIALVTHPKVEPALVSKTSPESNQGPKISVKTVLLNCVIAVVLGSLSAVGTILALD